MKLRHPAQRLGYVAVLALGTFAAAAPHAFGDDIREQHASAQHYSGHDSKKAANELIQTVRQVTARFRDVRVAQAEEYNLMFGCVTGEYSGAMGLHYVNMAKVMDGGKLDPTQPEIVIYEPLPNGKLRLIGADYLVLAADWKGSTPPEINGQLLHYIESPNRYGLPAFYTLHVWAWKDNPTGAFTNWHANVSCDAYNAEVE